MSDDVLRSLARQVSDLLRRVGRLERTEPGIPAPYTLENHAHAGMAGDGGPFDASNLTSGSADADQVLTADGSGGAAWADARIPIFPNPTWSKGSGDFALTTEEGRGIMGLNPTLSQPGVLVAWAIGSILCTAWSSAVVMTVAIYLDRVQQMQLTLRHAQVNEETPYSLICPMRVAAGAHELIFAAWKGGTANTEIIRAQRYLGYIVFPE